VDQLREEDKAFLHRLASPRRHTTFATLVLNEIRGHPWKPGGVPQTDPRLILCLVHDELSRDGRDTEKAQWCQAITTYWDEAQRYVRWLLAWEQRSKREKDAYRRQQYLAYQRSLAPGTPM
jgi:hypothetical protein